MPFSEKQQEFFEKADHRWNFKVGATRSGKTYMDYYMIPKRIRSRIGKDGLCVILGVSKATIERNVLEPMRNIWPADLIGRIGSNNTCRIFGETVHCLGAEKVSQVSKLRGASIKYCYGDEVADWHPEVFELLKSRLDKPYSCFDGALNPQGPNHWLKEFLNSEADIYAQQYTIFDNPFLPEEFVENLCKEYAGTVYYKRYILGEWALADGLVYPMYEEAIEETPDESAEKYILSIDYGTQNAFAGCLWEKHGEIWYMSREYYYSGRDTGAQKTDEDYAQDLDEFIADIKPGTRITTIIDPSAASFIALLKRRNHRYKVISAKNAVADGIRATARLMKSGKIKFSPDCVNWKKEVQGYVWDEKSGEDRPVKENDHLMDAVRYFVSTSGVANLHRAYKSVYSRL